MRFILNSVYLLLAMALMPMLVYRMIRHKRYRSGWANRFGKIARKYPDRKCVWIHAVSVGEVNATKTIVEQLQKKFGSFEIVISTTTDTGFARANTLYGNNLTITYFPLDFSWIMHRAFRNIKPTICLLMELEVWPNFTQTAYRLNIPVVVVNGRISERSFSRYKTIKLIAREMFNKLTLILAQTSEYAQRFIAIGCSPNKVIVTGSLKYDTAQVTDKIQGANALAAQLGINDERLWVAGATGNDEERLILNTFRKLKEQKQFNNLRLVIVPRKPERFDEVAQLIQQYGFDLIRFSQVKDSASPQVVNKQAVILGDTMGDLRKFYSLATIIFVGRSLVPMGGSDMIEAAALGKCTIFGPHTFNFKQAVDALLVSHGAIMVEDEDQLLQIMQKCLTESQFAEKTALNGREVIRKNQGATHRSIDQITKFL
jgi:3-deoxy-D-manno-octulosonic-acid transferase